MSYTATVTYKTFLMVEETTTWNKVVDIKDYPDLISPKEAVETTTLSDRARTYTQGIENVDGSGMTFTCNYDASAVARLEALKDTKKSYAIWFGGTDATSPGADPTPTGSLGKFEFDGILSWSIPGKGVNDVREITVTITPTTATTYTAGSSSL